MEKGISYSPQMVRAKKARTKKVTRRLLPDALLINLEPGRYKCHGIDTNDQGSVDKPVVLFEDLNPGDGTEWIAPIPVPYAVGDWLYTKEVWRTLSIYNEVKPVDVPDDAPIWYDADGPAPAEFGKYRYARFMPKKFARFWDEVTEVRCERVQDITEADALAEGVEIVEWGPIHRDGTDERYFKHYTDAAEMFTEAYPSFQTLWGSIYTYNNWDLNPWVFVVRFKELSRTGYPQAAPTPYACADTVDVAVAAATSALDTWGLTPTDELLAVLQNNPGQEPAILAAYELGLSNLRDVLSTISTPREPGKLEGKPPYTCINDMPRGVVTVLNTTIAARVLEMCLPFSLQYMAKDERRLLGLIEPHLQAFLNRSYAGLSARGLLRPKEGVTQLQATKKYVEEMGDLHYECLHELNCAADPREPHSAMKMYNELNMVGAVPEEVAEPAEMEAAGV